MAIGSPNARCAAVLILIMLSAPGCDGLFGAAEDSAAALRQRLLGAWIAGDDAQRADGDIGQTMQRALAEDTFRFEFQSDTALAISTGRDDAVQQGSWQVVEAGEQRSVIAIHAAELYGDQPIRFVIRFDGRDRFVMTRADQPDDHDALAFTFTRLR